jgi:DNA-directed RNA polymerase subunit beta-beta'
LENLPAQYRQNHPSFRGLICPVETPESELIGLTLHVARGAGVDIFGKLQTAVRDCRIVDEVGYAASEIPFYEFNDGARAMIGAKNIKQAVPVRNTALPRIG